MVPIPDFDMETLRLCHRASFGSNVKITGPSLLITDVGVKVKGPSQRKPDRQHRQSLCHKEGVQRLCFLPRETPKI